MKYHVDWWDPHKPLPRATVGEILERLARQHGVQNQRFSTVLRQRFAVQLTAPSALEKQTLLVFLPGALARQLNNLDRGRIDAALTKALA